MASNFDFNTTVAYETAGVQFNVALQGLEFVATVDDLASGDRLTLDHEVSAAVYDFTRGYARWLGSKGITATQDASAVRGVARDGLSAAQLLAVAREAVDMVDQRFSQYRTNVVSGDGYSDVVYEKRDGVAWLMLNRPETFNAKRGITMDEMSAALLDAAGDNEVRAVVLSGAGPNGFCTGNDQSYDPTQGGGLQRHGDAELQQGVAGDAAAGDRGGRRLRDRLWQHHGVRE